MAKKYIWMAVTNDELELPIAWGDDRASLGRKLGLTPQQVSLKAIRDERARTRGITGEAGRPLVYNYRIVKVRNDE